MVCKNILLALLFGSLSCLLEVQFSYTSFCSRNHPGTRSQFCNTIHSRVCVKLNTPRSSDFSLDVSQTRECCNHRECCNQTKCQKQVGVSMFILMEQSTNVTWDPHVAKLQKETSISDSQSTEKNKSFNLAHVSTCSVRARSHRCRAGPGASRGIWLGRQSSCEKESNATLNTTNH